MTVRDTSVKYFDSTMTNAPIMSGTAGALIAILDACLINGFGTVSATSLAISSGIATLTVDAGHGLANPGGAVVDVGVVVAVAGVTGALSALNANWRATITSSTVLTWECGVSIPDGTASGTITVNRAPAGWEKRYSGTNKAAYARTNVTATAMLLRVDDTPAQYPVVHMYESMSSVDDGTSGTSTLYFGKSDAASTSARPWRLVADSKAFYLYCNNDQAFWRGSIIFGDFTSYKSGDIYNCMLAAHSAAGNNSAIHIVNSASGAFYYSRSYTQLGGAIAGARYTHAIVNSSIGIGTISGLNGPDNSLVTWPVECWEGSTIARGVMPGFYCPLHSNLPTDGAVYLSSDGKGLLGQLVVGSSTRVIMDISGPWRQ